MQQLVAHVTVGNLAVDTALYRFVRDEVLPGSGIDARAFWRGFDDIVHEFAPRHRALLARRAELQTAIDAWHRDRIGEGFDAESYRAFLDKIGYLEPDPRPFQIGTPALDVEVASVGGPQVVVPLSNARYSLNAANARWGSLYDALYGTDALGIPPPMGSYDAARGADVIDWARRFLDDTATLATGSHADVIAYRVADRALQAELRDGSLTTLDDAAVFVGYGGDPGAPSSVLLRHHDLHIELRIDRAHPVGRDDPAGVADVVLEAAVTAVMDCEDSVVAVDAVDKVRVYRTWLGLMRGDLEEIVAKPTGTIRRRLADDRTFIAPDGSTFDLPGRAVLFVRNVGMLMTTDAVRDRDGAEVPEGILDAMVTVLAGTHDIRRTSGRRNSRAGSIYVVKPKLHGPDEAAVTEELISRVEDVLGLPSGTVKIGLMDEERRTSANLAACIRALRTRIAFVNTGFLDRTGDEIHTSMEAGPIVRKADMKSQPWLAAYEDRNVAIALGCGFEGRAQIGKGIWAAPDRMAEMLEAKIAHPRAGATCAWVPSPTAATLHAIHYHRVDVRREQTRRRGAPPAPLEALLTIPVASAPAWSAVDVVREVENNAQGILGYVVRWVDQGVGCSKVPDINDVALMEDRATCRISSQHIANWLHHGVVDADMVIAAMKRMATIVDAQNASDPLYSPMSPSFDGAAFRAACDLVFSGTEQPSGYTEPVLHAARRGRKLELTASGA